METNGRGPASKPNFGNDQDENAINPAVAGMLGNEQDQKQFMEFYAKLLEK